MIERSEKNIMRYSKIIIVPLLLITPLFAKKYYIRHQNGNQIIIINEKHQIISNSFIDFLRNIQSKDTLLFKRGEVFKLPVNIIGKKDIVIKDYGSKKLNKPIIDTRYSIPPQKIEYFDVLYDENLTQDKSFKSLESAFRKNYARVKGSIRDKIAKSFLDVKKNIYSVVRVKLDFINFDPNALRVWVNNKERLKSLLFEELKCDNCSQKIKWFYDKKYKYLYLFALKADVDLWKDAQNIKINSVILDSLNLSDDENITIQNLDIRGSKYAIGIRGSKNILIEKCKIGRYSFTGIDIMNDIDDYNKSSENIVIQNCTIEAGYNGGKYRYLSSRGVQDGIFIVGGVKNSLIKDNTVNNWGHSGINLYSPSSKNSVTGNHITNNVINGDKMPYMHGITVDGSNCVKNEISSNIIKNTTARNQLNGAYNIFSKNIIYNLKNSQIKLDQGYSAGQGIQLQAYGKTNIAKNNIIKNNLFAKIDEAAISVVNYRDDGIKKNNVFKNNVILNSGLKNNNIALEIINYSKNDAIKGNSFIQNRFKLLDSKPKINYRGKILSIEEFNEQNGENNDTIDKNTVFKE